MPLGKFNKQVIRHGVYDSWGRDTVTKSYTFLNAVHETNNTKYSLKQFEIISPLLTKLNTVPNVFSPPEEQCLYKNVIQNAGR